MREKCVALREDTSLASGTPESKSRAGGAALPGMGKGVGGLSPSRTGMDPHSAYSQVYPLNIAEQVTF